MSQIKLFFKLSLVVLMTILVVFSGLFIWQNFFSNMSRDGTKTGDSFTVTVDKTAIIQQIQSMEKLETVRLTIQRDVQITIDLGDLELFGITLLENKRTQDFAVTGYVSAGIDLSRIKTEDIIITPDRKEVLIKLPAPQILDANIIEDQTRILREDITVLYNLETLNAERRKELNEKLFQQIIRESRKTLVRAACDDNILVTSQENSRESMEKLFGKLMSDNFYIETTTASNCSLEGV